MQTPVLFLVFNRPELTQQVFDVIRQVKPTQLYIAADGPRVANPVDALLCAQVRTIVNEIDWHCEVKTLFRDENLGCKTAVSRAIDWFFDHVEEGIILEDDCLPDRTFFPYCTELLSRYRDDDSVMSVSGSNLLGKPWKYDKQSYFFAHGGIWGWATWKRAWKLYDEAMKDWPRSETKKVIRENIQTKGWYDFYLPMFEASHNGTLDTWDIQWFYTILINNGLAINPAVNLVRNIGFASGTHLNSDDNAIARLESRAIAFPLVAPTQEKADIAYLKLIYQVVTAKASMQKFSPGRVIRYLLRAITHKKPTPQS
ncbi:glycosyltransferase family 2 protein [Mucilaginibacter psychrotolerans]|uniref:Glycosyltransferase family 2 protein n=1 Tax=Mucilaginibacter psychrotolerans TaxID=1524096 RepID=A0A4Y8SR69_9SPHI|nr:glycosyltransferase family 2 protein [Mucilaginibacter psychrotolerans]TFF40874.1 glycosyltransferase family 2 protein [Mucilaginibacter psychrotolerans]